jgi:hypothetical protein
MAQDFVHGRDYQNTDFINIGSAFRDDFDALVTNFSGDIEPTNPVNGQVWIDTSTSEHVMKQYNSSQDSWIDVDWNTLLGKDMRLARGTKNTLWERLETALNPDGTLKTDQAENMTEWIDSALTPTFISDNSFSVEGNHTDIFIRDRRVKFTLDTTTVFSGVKATNYISGSNTTEIEIFDNIIDNTLQKVEYSIIKSGEETSLPRYDNFQTQINADTYQSAITNIDNNLAIRLSDILTEGILTGGSITENSTPDLNVIIESLTGYNSVGARIKLDSSKTVDLSSYLPTTAGNEKYISVYINVIDLETNTEINVVEGTSASAGSATKPSVDSNQGVLLADILLTEGQTTILNDNIEVARKQKIYLNNIAGQMDYVNVKDFGAIGDGVTDDLTEINNAIDKANSENKILYIPKGVFVVSGSLNRITTNVIFDGKILYTGTDYKTILKIGDTSQKTTEGIYKNINVERENQSDWNETWNDEIDNAVRMDNIRDSFISIVNASNFTVGCKFVGNTQGFSGNVIKLGKIHNNKIGIDLRIEGSSSGFVNDNYFIKGDITIFTQTINTSISRYGIRFASNDYNKAMDANTFNTTLLQLMQHQLTDGAEAVPILFEEKSTANKFLNIRNEFNDGLLARGKKRCKENVYTVSYQDKISYIENLTDSPTNNYIFDERLTGKYKKIYKSGLIQKKSAYYNYNNDRVNVANMIMKYYNDDVLFNDRKYLDSANIDFSNYNISFSGLDDLGIIIDTSEYKKIAMEYFSDENCYAVAKLYDSGKNMIVTPQKGDIPNGGDYDTDTEESGENLTKGSTDGRLKASNTPGNGRNFVELEVGDNVDYVFFGVTGGILENINFYAEESVRYWSNLGENQREYYPISQDITGSSEYPIGQKVLKEDGTGYWILTSTGWASKSY